MVVVVTCRGLGSGGVSVSLVEMSCNSCWLGLVLGREGNSQSGRGADRKRKARGDGRQCNRKVIGGGAVGWAPTV